MTRTSTSVGKEVLTRVGKFAGGTVQNESVGSFTGKPGERLTLLTTVRYSRSSSRSVLITNLNRESSWPIATTRTGVPGSGRVICVCLCRVQRSQSRSWQQRRQRIKCLSRPTCRTFTRLCRQPRSLFQRQNPMCHSHLKQLTTNHHRNTHNTRLSSTLFKPVSSSSASSIMGLSSNWSLFQRRRHPSALFFLILSCRTLLLSYGRPASCTFSQSQRVVPSFALSYLYTPLSNSGLPIWLTTGVANIISNM